VAKWLLCRSKKVVVKKLSSFAGKGVQHVGNDTVNALDLACGGVVVW
jgi:hypothetical protein